MSYAHPTASAHFLESLDSVRLTPFTPPHDAAHQRLLIFSEVLMTLALNRDIVVPQSYAFDSWGCAQVAAAVLVARDDVAAEIGKRRAVDEEKVPRPFRVQLHEANSFRDAAVGMLKRMDDEKEPFFSSSFSSLNHTEKKAATEIAERIKKQEKESNLEPLVQAIDKDLSHSFKTTWAEFDKPRATQAEGKRGDGKDTTNPVMSLKQAVKALTANPAVEARLKEAGLAAQEAIEEVRKALGRLQEVADADGVDAFANRSYVHKPGAWPGAPNGESAADLVGAPAMELVTEFIDSLYNYRLAGTALGLGAASFSTPALHDQRSAGARPARGSRERSQAFAYAQDLALLFGEDHRRTSGTARSRTVRSFEVTASATEPDRTFEQSPQALKDTLQELESQQTEAFRVLLDARYDERFTMSASSLHEAASQGDHDQVARAIEAHIKIVSGLYKDFDWEMPLPGLFVMKVAGATAEALTGWWLTKSGNPLWAELGAAAAGRYVESALEKPLSALIASNRTHHLAHAMGRLVRVSPV